MNDETKEKETPETKTDAPADTNTDKKDEGGGKPEDDKALKSALAQKDHFREKFEESEKARKDLEAELNKGNQGKGSKGLDVEQFLDISTSLEGLDQREKSYLAEQHKLTGKPLTEIRKSEDFQLWDTAYQDKRKKDLAVTPDGTQTETDKPKSFTEEISSASLADKEKMLIEKGLYKPNRPRSDRVDIGGKK